MRCPRTCFLAVRVQSSTMHLRMLLSCAFAFPLRLRHLFQFLESCTYSRAAGARLQHSGEGLLCQRSRDISMTCCVFLRVKGLSHSVTTLPIRLGGNFRVCIV